MAATGSGYPVAAMLSSDSKIRQVSEKDKDFEMFQKINNSSPTVIDSLDCLIALADAEGQHDIHLTSTALRALTSMDTEKRMEFSTYSYGYMNLRRADGETLYFYLVYVEGQFEDAEPPVGHVGSRYIVIGAAASTPVFECDKCMEICDNCADRACYFDCV